MEGLLLLTLGLAIGFSGAVVPGPLFTATIKDTLRYGPLSGPLVCVGHLFVEIPIVIALSLGVSYIINIPLVRAFIGIVGGLGLFYLGIGIIKDRKKYEKMSEENMKDLKSDGFKAKKEFITPLKTGFIFTILNPAIFLWWFTVGNGLVMRGLAIGFIGVFLLFLGHWIADISWYSFVSFSLFKGKRFIKPKVYEVILLSCGILLLVIGLYFLYDSVPFINHYI